MYDSKGIVFFWYFHYSLEMYSKWFANKCPVINCLEKSPFLQSARESYNLNPYDSYKSINVGYLHICSIVPVPAFIFCCFKMTQSFARAVWQADQNDVPLINFTMHSSWLISPRQRKYVFSLTSLVSNDSDKGQAEISSDETNTDCVNNHHSHKQEMCRWWSYSGSSAVCLSVLYCLKPSSKLKNIQTKPIYSCSKNHMSVDRRWTWCKCRLSEALLTDPFDFLVTAAVQHLWKLT